jgi:hypothetical protein
VRAPSMHNAQPWRFTFDTAAETVRLYADMNSSMPRTDPDLRALHLGCGAALFNLRVSAAHAGLRADVRLLPGDEDPFLLATVRLRETERPDPGLTALHQAIRRRHTSRRPFSDREVPQIVLSGLADAARDEGAHLIFPDTWHTDMLLNLVHDAEGRDTLDPEAFSDVARWTPSVPRRWSGPRRGPAAQPRAGPPRSPPGSVRSEAPGRPCAPCRARPAHTGGTADRAAPRSPRGPHPHVG